MPASALEMLARGLAGPGVELIQGTPWEPLSRAREAVERYAQDPQEPGGRIDLIRWDKAAKRLDFYLLDPGLPSKCPRFASRACPRMEPMGHEPAQPTCNYWDYPRMPELAPGIELYPEWQRFDCHKFYPLFQAHLLGEACAAELGASVFFTVLSPRPEDEKMIASYANLSSRPDAFSWRLLS